MLKREYETPLVEVITFRMEDVLTASPDGWTDGDPGDGSREIDGEGLLSTIKNLLDR